MNGVEWGRTNSAFGTKEAMILSMNMEVKTSKI